MRYRVLHVHALPVISGSGINTWITMRDVNRHRFESELACAPGGELEDLVRSSGFAFHSFPHFVQPVDPVSDMTALIRLTGFLRKGKYHVVHTHNSKTGFIGRLAGKLAGVPVVVHTVHGFSFHAQETLLRQHLFRFLERSAARWADRMIFISRPLVAWARREHIVGKKDKIAIIYSGIEIDKFQPADAAQRRMNRRAYGISAGAFTVGIVSKLWEGKGHAVLIEAFARLGSDVPDPRLVIVGEGPLRHELEVFARRRGVYDRVVFTGFRRDVARMIAMLDLAVLPSFFEGMGRVLLEAMAMGVPVIGSEVGGIPDLIQHGRQGYLVPPGDADALAKAIRTIALDPQKAKEMGKAGMRRVSGKFSARKMVRDIEQLYLDALGEKGL